MIFQNLTLLAYKLTFLLDKQFTEVFNNIYVIYIVYTIYYFKIHLIILLLLVLFFEAEQ